MDAEAALGNAEETPFDPVFCLWPVEIAVVSSRRWLYGSLEVVGSCGRTTRCAADLGGHLGSARRHWRSSI